MPPHPPFATDDPPAPGHIPIMVEQILDLLAPKPGETYIDLTIGRAGHALAVAPKLSANGCLIAFDLDQSNLTFSKARLKREILDSRRPTLVFHHTNFAAAPDISAQTDQKADLVLAEQLAEDEQRLRRVDVGRDLLEGPLDARVRGARGALVVLDLEVVPVTRELDPLALEDPAHGIDVPRRDLEGPAGGVTVGHSISFFLRHSPPERAAERVLTSGVRGAGRLSPSV